MSLAAGKALIEEGRAIRNRALDATSLGVALQRANRDKADDEGYVEDLLWTGVGRARSGCGAALVGSVDQVLSRIHEYMAMGMRAFIFSGYPHLDECETFGTKVLPELRTVSLPHAYGRVPAEVPATPLRMEATRRSSGLEFMKPDLVRSRG